MRSQTCQRTNVRKTRENPTWPSLYSYLCICESSRLDRLEKRVAAHEARRRVRVRSHSVLKMVLQNRCKPQQVHLHTHKRLWASVCTVRGGGHSMLSRKARRWDSCGNWRPKVPKLAACGIASEPLQPHVTIFRRLLNYMSSCPNAAIGKQHCVYRAGLTHLLLLQPLSKSSSPVLCLCLKPLKLRFLPHETIYLNQQIAGLSTENSMFLLQYRVKNARVATIHVP
jgi:hypothetical protein